MGISEEIQAAFSHTHTQKELLRQKTSVTDEKTHTHLSNPSITLFADSLPVIHLQGGAAIINSMLNKEKPPHPERCKKEPEYNLPVGRCIRRKRLLYWKPARSGAYSTAMEYATKPSLAGFRRGRGAAGRYHQILIWQGEDSVEQHAKQGELSVQIKKEQLAFRTSAKFKAC